MAVSANWLHSPSRLCHREGAFTQFTFQNGQESRKWLTIQICHVLNAWEAKKPLYGTKNLSKGAKTRVRVLADIQNFALRAHCVHGIPNVPNNRLLQLPNCPSHGHGRGVPPPPMCPGPWTPASPQNGPMGGSDPPPQERGGVARALQTSGVPPPRPQCRGPGADLRGSGRDSDARASANAGPRGGAPAPGDPMAHPHPQCPPPPSAHPISGVAVGVSNTPYDGSWRVTAGGNMHT